jgi:cell division protein FtsL
MGSWMHQEDVERFKPFLSVSFIILTLFGLVFLKMEERRVSYEVLRKTREFKKTSESQKQKEIELARLIKPQYIENVAKEKLTLKRISPAQIIHLNPKEQVTFHQVEVVR